MKRNENSHMNRDEFIEKLKANQLEHHLAEFEALARPCIRLYLAKEDEGNILVGSSKIGGRPDLPLTVEWPYETERPFNERDLRFKQRPVKNELLPLSFVAQINLSEVSQLDEENLLPKSGMVYFFYSAEQKVWGFDPRDYSGFKIIYYDGDMSKLVRHRPPANLPEYARFTSCSIQPRLETNYPPPFLDELRFLSEEELDLYDRSFEEFPVNKIFGYADIVQDEMELECELVTNGLYCGDATGYNDPKRQTLEANIDQWKLLLQIDSNEEDCGMMWGDVGRIYYWIRKDDLLNKQFDKAWLILQCS